MSTKRKTKAQRESERKAALYQRVHDVYSGALGAKWDSEGNGDFANAEQLTDIMWALKCLFGQQSEHEYYWNIHHIKYFDTPESATEYLFDAGFRA